MTEKTIRREFLKTALAAMASAGGVGILTSASCNRQSEIRNPTREELVKRLQKLAESKPPKNLAIGAMCYKPATPPRCSDCERRLDYDGTREIDLYRVPVERLRKRGLDATLIAPELCPTCGSALDKKKFFLAITYPDYPDSVHVELENTNDLMIMELFLQGKDRYDAGMSGEIPLKDRVDRLRELFGVKENL